MKYALATLAALILWAIGSAAMVVSVVALLSYTLAGTIAGLLAGTIAGLLALPLAMALWAGLIINLHSLIND